MFKKKWAIRIDSELTFNCVCDKHIHPTILVPINFAHSLHPKIDNFEYFGIGTETVLNDLSYCFRPTHELHRQSNGAQMTNESIWPMNPQLN